MNLRIKRARSKREIEEIRALFREYEEFLKVDLSFQSFEEELASLPGNYFPPDGDLLISFDGERAVGCVALCGIDESICEMKRLYVRPEARGRGLGKRLAQEIIEISKDLDYSLIRLDTLDRLEQAVNLYEDLGFIKIAPYYENPLSGVIYWEKKLKD